MLAKLVKRPLRLLLMPVIVVFGCSATDADSDATATDTGISNLDGLILSDVDPSAEAFEIEPSSIEFPELAVGETHELTVEIVNNSTSPLLIESISLVDTATDLRFTLSYIARLASSNWFDLNGDGHDFETRELAFEVAPQGRFEVDLELLRTREDGPDCLDPAPAACGFLTVVGNERTVASPLIVPR